MANLIKHALGLSLSLLLLAVPGPLSAGEVISGTTGGRAWLAYLPSDYNGAAPVPLMIMLHGCTQSAQDFATSTTMNDLAEAHNFIVIYPEQPSSANMARCWNWFEPINQGRSGEAASIAGIVTHFQNNYAIDANRMYCAGFSAGGAMTSIMGAVYSDLFAGIAVHSGLEFKAATSSQTAFSVMSNGGPNPNTQGNLAFDAMGPRARILPTIVFHGTSDFTVAPINGEQTLSQWAQTNDRVDNGADDDSIDDTPEDVRSGTVAGGRSYTHSLYEDASGQVLLEHYSVDGMGHAWSGGEGFLFTDPNGPDASALIVTFFGLDGSAVDTTPPITTATPAGGVYHMSVTVSLTANEPAVTHYTTDGSLPTEQSPVWTAAQTFDETTVLRFFSIDDAGNVESPVSETYTIDNTPDTTPPTTLAEPAGGTYTGPVSVTLSADEPATTHYTRDGSAPDGSSPTYVSPILLESDTQLKFRSVDQAGNWESVKTENYVIEAPSAIELRSIGAEDGYVGLYFADGFSTSDHVAGDPGMFNAERKRIILSFDTASIPADVTLAGATLVICRQDLTGSVSRLDVDLKSGSFSNDAALSRGDYSAAASGTNVFTIAIPSANDACTETALPASALSLIRRDGRTQFRLKAATTVDFQRDELTIYGGEHATLGARLILSVE
ncbi:PHB depolymerase family esterase [Sulfidibacter corallicola]|uniref:PHB depolymerase family esterase n=1 Tax=Sulfidibacter corallicola TaxID=2818388 RepID=A0A8A4TJK9_SULCO|nr:PHB depolymerase family esterase [Sulfidibacter corallicola]QTD48988.1 PHB depolymerase family esterase [Sulfidibacter corallicola]